MADDNDIDFLIERFSSNDISEEFSPEERETFLREFNNGNILIPPTAQNAKKLYDLIGEHAEAKETPENESFWLKARKNVSTFLSGYRRTNAAENILDSMQSIDRLQTEKDCALNALKSTSISTLKNRLDSLSAPISAPMETSNAVVQKVQSQQKADLETAIEACKALNGMDDDAQNNLLETCLDGNTSFLQHLQLNELKALSQGTVIPDASEQTAGVSFNPINDAVKEIDRRLKNEILSKQQKKDLELKKKNLKKVQEAAQKRIQNLEKESKKISQKYDKKISKEKDGIVKRANKIQELSFNLEKKNPYYKAFKKFEKEALKGHKKEDWASLENIMKEKQFETVFEKALLRKKKELKKQGVELSENTNIDDLIGEYEVKVKESSLPKDKEKAEAVLAKLKFIKENGTFEQFKENISSLKGVKITVHTEIINKPEDEPVAPVSSNDEEKEERVEEPVEQRSEPVKPVILNSEINTPDVNYENEPWKKVSEKTFYKEELNSDTGQRNVTISTPDGIPSVEDFQKLLQNYKDTPIQIGKGEDKFKLNLMEAAIRSNIVINTEGMSEEDKKLLDLAKERAENDNQPIVLSQEENTDKPNQNNRREEAEKARNERNKDLSEIAGFSSEEDAMNKMDILAKVSEMTPEKFEEFKNTHAAPDSGMISQWDSLTPKQQKLLINIQNLKQNKEFKDLKEQQQAMLVGRLVAKYKQSTQEGGKRNEEKARNFVRSFVPQKANTDGGR